MSMEQYTVRATETGIALDEFPNAVKVIKIDGPEAGQAADLSLHQHDLKFAHDCLLKIVGLSSQPDQELVQHALWMSAMVSFFKCFGGGVRAGLDPIALYGQETPASQVFDYFKALRDKHVVHDVNAFAQSSPGAVLNQVGDEHKIAKITFTNEYAETLEQQRFDGFLRLVTRALEVVASDFETACDKIWAELEALPYSELLARDVVTLRGPVPTSHITRSRSSGHAPGRKTKKKSKRR